MVSMSLYGNIFLVVKGLSFSNLVQKYKIKWWNYQKNFFFLLSYDFFLIEKVSWGLHISTLA